jgi:hypothetical protein
MSNWFYYEGIAKNLPFPLRRERIKVRPDMKNSFLEMPMNYFKGHLPEKKQNPLKGTPKYNKFIFMVVTEWPFI